MAVNSGYKHTCRSCPSFSIGFQTSSKTYFFKDPPKSLIFSWLQNEYQKSFFTFSKFAPCFFKIVSRILKQKSGNNPIEKE